MDYEHHPGQSAVLENKLDFFCMSTKTSVENCLETYKRNNNYSNAP